MLSSLGFSTLFSKPLSLFVSCGLWAVLRCRHSFPVVVGFLLLSFFCCWGHCSVFLFFPLLLPCQVVGFFCSATAAVIVFQAIQFHYCCCRFLVVDILVVLRLFLLTVFLVPLFLLLRLRLLNFLFLVASSCRSPFYSYPIGLSWTF